MLPTIIISYLAKINYIFNLLKNENLYSFCFYIYSTASEKLLIYI